MVRIPTHRPPTRPGKMLLEEFLVPAEITQRELADAIHVRLTAGYYCPRKFRTSAGLTTGVDSAEKSCGFLVTK